MAAIALNSEKETLVPVRSKETVSEKNQLPFFRRDGGSVFVAISCPISVRLRPNMHVESVGAAFAPMKKYPPGRLPAEHLICYSMLIGSYTHFRLIPRQRRSVSWGRKRCVFV